VSKKEKLVDLDPVLYVHDTEKAWLLEYEGEQFWIPKSRCEYDREEQVLTLDEKLAIDKELV
jgi:hypothetical protein